MNHFSFNRNTNIKGWFKAQNIVVQLIAVNVLVFLFIRVLLAFFPIDLNNINNIVYTLFAVPSNLHTLFLRPWTLLTYMFAHFDFTHILFNMIWLYLFGKIFLEYLNSKQLITVYLLGGLSGALFYIISFNLFPNFEFARLVAQCVGASASIMAIVFAIAFYVPNYVVQLILIGPVKIKYIAMVSIGIDLIMIDSSNSGGHLAHIGGAAFGYFFFKQLSKGNDISLFLVGLKKNIYSYLTKKSTLKVKYGQGKRSVSDEEYHKQRNQNQAKIDIILEKISKSGYESLTKDEKDFLFKSSNNN